MNPLDAKSILGKKLRWKFTEGPTKGSSYDHTFGEDGSVSFAPADGPQKGKSSRVERVGVLPAGERVLAVSYLSNNGYTLTVVMNFADHTLVGFASNEKEWHPLRGTFEEVGAPTPQTR